MKSTITTIAALFMIATGANNMNAQGSDKASLTVINIDVKGLNEDPAIVGNQVRMETEKLNMYEVKDKYDVQQFLEDNQLSMNKCFGKTCLVELGKQLHSDKMLTGSVELFGKYIVVTYRLIDVNNNSIEKTYVHEFLNLPEEIRSMIKLSVADMFGGEVDKNLMTKLSKPFAFDNLNNNPDQDRLRLDGPRLGFVSFTGDLFTRIQDSKDIGGFDALPVMFQFGYQFEKQYLNEGNAQALIEFIPLITGLDQGYFIPSFTLLHGLRSNVNGWEFAIGPTFNFMPFANGYFDSSNAWYLERQWHENPANQGVNNPYKIQSRIDRRGNYKLNTGFVIAVGRTFKSGKLNIPVNAFATPSKHGFRFGVSFGFNARNK
ncbi:MAG: hypothetical protein KF900_03035 [Bacteroidetes bacterium]|nr:hypothetical protein [Bacteroidota bacterium]